MNHTSSKTKLFTIIIALILVFSIFLILQTSVNAATNAPANTDGAAPRFFGEGNSICAWIKGFYDFGISVIGILATVVLMVAGVIYIASGGAPGQISLAKEVALGGIIGLVLGLTSYLILTILKPSLTVCKEEFLENFANVNIENWEDIEYEEELQDVGKCINCFEGEVPLVDVVLFGKTIQVNQLVQSAFECVNSKVDPKDYRPVDGSYVCRNMRGSNKPSMHSYGLAVDIDPQNNPFCPSWPQCHGRNVCITNMPQSMISAFKSCGFTWGCDWRSSKDAMHFQIACPE